MFKPMKIKLTVEHKKALLRALQSGILNTDEIPELRALVELREPARILSKEEATDLLKTLENEY
jgi:hypothetical protein